LRSTYAELVERFGHGWEKGSSKLITEIFTDDAVFVPDPFAEPITGLTDIERYWTDVPLEQSNISFRYGEIFVAGPWFATEFRCTFRRRRTGEPVDVRGTIFCETDEGKISELRMYWHRRAG
jgi:ketosteroid isomerase-like protein